MSHDHSNIPPKPNQPRKPAGTGGSASSTSKALNDADQAFLRYQETGDPVHLGEVFDATAGELTRVAHYLTPDFNVADDLLQATFLTAIESRHDYKGQGHVQGWLFGILVNHLRVLRRQSGRTLGNVEAFLESGLQEGVAALGMGGSMIDAVRDGGRASGSGIGIGSSGGDGSNPHKNLEAKELAKTVMDAIGRMPEQYRPVLTLHLHYGLSASEIAFNLHRPGGTVRKQLCRALDMLRQALPTSLIAGAVALTTPAHGLAAIREVVLTKAAAVTAAGKVAKVSALLGKTHLSCLGVELSLVLGTLAGLAILREDPDLGRAHPAVTMPQNQGYVDMKPAIQSEPLPTSWEYQTQAQSSMSSLYSSACSPISMYPDPRRVLNMNPKNCTLFSLALVGATLLFPTLIPAQSHLYSLPGQNANDFFGARVSGAGDTNVDGYPDLLVAAMGWDSSSKSNVGRVYVISGRDGTVLFTREGENASDDFGISLGGGIDANIDGFTDIVVGARLWDTPNTTDGRGRVYVYSGLNGSVLHTFQGENAKDRFGWASGGAADLDLDGYDDVVAGAYAWPSFGFIGRVYAYSGKDGSLIHAVNGEIAPDNFGNAVSGAKDVNLDGYNDFMASAEWDNPADSPNTDHGRVYVYSGKDGSLIHAFNGEKGGNSLGYFDVRGADDLDQDGYGDLIMGSTSWVNPNSGNSVGRTYVYSGKNGGLMYVLDGENAWDSMGVSVSGAMDLNLDGHADFMASAYQWDDPATAGKNDGRVYVHSGKDGSLLFVLQGEPESNFGTHISQAGDVNADGHNDVLIGAASWTNAPGTFSYHGKIYVYSGTPLPLTSDEHLLSISQASTQNLSLDAGPTHAGRQYWVFGNFAVNGTSPGVALGAVNIPLNPDPWTQVTIDFVNTAALSTTKGTLDGTGQASASLNSLAPQPAAPLGLTLQHCYLVYQSGPPDTYYMASNLVPWTTVP